ncbi:hypothetical protein GCM10017750_47600 [Streptomyces racemochromogenes]
MRSRFYSPYGGPCGLSSGGSGVILRIALAPGLSPSPGRSWLRPTLLVPIHAFRCAQCTGRGAGRQTGFEGPGGASPGGSRRDPDGLTGGSGIRWGGWGGLRGSPLGTTDAG